MQSRGLLAARQRQQYRLLTPTKHLLQQDTASWMHSARPADGAVPVGDPPSRLGREADAGRNALPRCRSQLKAGHLDDVHIWTICVLPVQTKMRQLHPSAHPVPCKVASVLPLLPCRWRSTSWSPT